VKCWLWRLLCQGWPGEAKPGRSCSAGPPIALAGLRRTRPGSADLACALCLPGCWVWRELELCESGVMRPHRLSTADLLSTWLLICGRLAGVVSLRPVSRALDQRQCLAGAGSTSFLGRKPVTDVVRTLFCRTLGESRCVRLRRGSSRLCCSVRCSCRANAD
jgi:hypothetical protein